MLTAEIFTSKTTKGYKKYYWEKLRDRNEALDCRVYGLACLAQLGYERWTEEKFLEVSNFYLSASADQPKVIKKKVKKKKNNFSGYL